MKKISIFSLIFLFSNIVLAAERSVIISEFLPNPSGYDKGQEWIELENLTGKEIDLNNWFLKDRSGKKEIIKKVVIKPYSFYLIKPLNSLTINNNGELLILFNNKKEKIFSIEYYGKAKEGLSFSRSQNGQWQWEKPTPGKKNTFLRTRKKLNIASLRELEAKTNNHININFVFIFISGLFFSLFLAIITAKGLNKFYKN